MEIGADRIIVVERWKGGPGGIKLYVRPFTSKTCVTLSLTGVKTQDEFGRRRNIREGLIVTVEKDASTTVRNLADLFSKFLRVPLLENVQKDTSFRASMHFSGFRVDEIKISFRVSTIVDEVGPALIVKRPINSSGEEQP